MPRAYCAESDVILYIPDNLIVQGEVSNPPIDPINIVPESVSISAIDFYIQQACQYVDACLSTQYDIPLVRTNQGGVVDYPSPIPAITALLASQMIYQQKLQGADKQRSESAKEREKWAHEALSAIQNGEMRLVGQRQTRGSRFLNGNLPNIPHNPAEGGRSKGSNN